MNLEDTLKKHDESIVSLSIKCQYIAFLHHSLKDELKMTKELRKEINERIVEKAKEVIKTG